MTARRVTNLYDLMDSATTPRRSSAPALAGARCDHRPSSAWPRRAKGRLEAEQRRRRLLAFSTAEDLRYRERTTVERVNARLKDEFGGDVRVRGHLKVMCHLMFGILALTADQILRLIPPLSSERLKDSDTNSKARATESPSASPAWRNDAQS